MKKEQRRYSPEVRAEALKLVAAGEKNTIIAEKLKISPAIITYWKGAQKKKSAKAERKAANGAAHGVQVRDVRDAMVFFNKALRLAAKQRINVLKDKVLLNVAYGVSLLETKV